MLGTTSARKARVIASGCASLSKLLSPAAQSRTWLPNRAASTATPPLPKRESDSQDKGGAERLGNKSAGQQGIPPVQITGPKSERQVIRGSAHIQAKKDLHASYKGKEKGTQAKNFESYKNAIKRSANVDRAAQRQTQRLSDRLKTIYESSSRYAEPIADGESDAIVSDNPIEEAPPEDPLASVQEHLRAFFAKKSGSRPSLLSNDLPFETPRRNAEIESQAYNDLDFGLMTAGVIRDYEASQAQEAEQVPLKFTRPTLSDLQKAELDEFIGLYQSDTAWDPNKDYTLMQDGPPRESYLTSVLKKDPRKFIIVILDGDNLLFDPRHMTKGYEGGKFVYKELRTRIAKKHQLIPHLLDLRVRIFCALSPLSLVLNLSRIVRREIFYDFLQGIIDSSLHNYVVNVGRGDQAADMRVKAALADALRDPRCYRAYLGGLDDLGYKEELNTIQETGLLENKVHLVQVPGFAVKSNAYKEYAHRAIDLDYLFKNYGAANMDMLRYDQEARGAADDSGTRTVGSKPCVFHHLSEEGCILGESCTYSHEPISMEYKGRLRSRLKQRKCPNMIRTGECHFGENCLFGH